MEHSRWIVSVDSVGQQNLIRSSPLCNATPFFQRFALGIARQQFSIERTQSGQHAGRAPHGTLVKIETQLCPLPQRSADSLPRFGISLTAARASSIGPNLALNASACPFKPSAVASATPGGPIRRIPSRDTCWQPMTRTKSSTLRPPRTRAIPPVGST